MAIIVGLTGGIGSGKSTVSKVWAKAGVPIVDADLIAREVVEPGTPGHSQVAANWDVLGIDGALDRKALAAIVFRDTRELRKLEKILHPLIEARAQELIAEASKRCEVVVFDNPLLFEVGTPHPGPIVVVYCPVELQIQRVMKRDSCTKEEAFLRVNAQFPLETKVRGADYVIHSTGTKEELAEQAHQVMVQIVGPVEEV